MADVPVPVIDKARTSTITDEETHPDDGIEIPSLLGHHRPPIMLRWVANAGYAIFLVIMAVLPSTSAALAISVPDWSAHAMAYGIQMALVYWASLPLVGHGRSLAVGVFAAGAFGLVTESLQLLQPSRTVELKDVAANIMGALIFCGVIAVVGTFNSRRAS
jgi:VanZ family protein